MISLDRSEALRAFGSKRMINLSKSERKNIVLELLNEDDSFNNFMSNDYDDAIINFLIETELVGVSNEYLGNRLSDMNHESIKVVGAIEELYPCVICNFRTLNTKGEYEICRVCFWEDDGSSVDDYSNVNSLNVVDAKNNFINFGAVSKESKKYVANDSREMFLSDKGSR